MDFEAPDVDLEAELLAAYGVEPDPVRTAYYRALWNATRADPAA